MISGLKHLPKSVDVETYITPLDLSKVFFILGFIPIAIVISIIIFLAEMVVK